MSHINQLRNKFNKSRHKPVSLDSFMFSVYEEEALLKGSFRLRKDSCFDDFEELMNKDIKPSEALAQIFSWYQERYPSLMSEGVLDFVAKTEVCLPVASMRLDFTKVLDHFSLRYPYEDLPKEAKVSNEEAAAEVPVEEAAAEVPVEEEAAEVPVEGISNEEAAAEVPVEEDAKVSNEEEAAEVPVEEEAAEVPVEEEAKVSNEEEAKVSNEEEAKVSEEATVPVEEEVIEDVEEPTLLRSEVEELFQSSFSNYISYFLPYFDWVYLDTYKLKPDFNSLPPSGRSLYYIRNSFPNSELVWGKKMKPPVQTFQEPQRSSKAEEKKALDEVHEAVKKFKRDKRLNSFQLQAQNSFLRRLQHSVVSSNGFDSKSSGEEPGRFLTIIRKKSGKEDSSK